MARRALTVALVAVVPMLAGFAVAMFLRGDDAADAAAAAGDIQSLPLLDLRRRPTPWSDLIGDKPVLANFWATWCPPCRHEIPLLEEAAATTPGVRVIGISNEDPDAAFVLAKDIAYATFTTDGDIFDFFRANGNPSGGLPYTALLDVDGRIVAEKIGPFHSAAEARQFAASAGAAPAAEGD